MTHKEILEIIKLLSAVESWSFADKHQMPGYLLEQLEACLEVLEKELLK
jgi:hypothetical protein